MLTERLATFQWAIRIELAALGVVGMSLEKVPRLFKRGGKMW
jgi:hypothetical protein